MGVTRSELESVIGRLDAEGPVAARPRWELAGGVTAEYMQEADERRHIAQQLRQVAELLLEHLDAP